MVTCETSVKERPILFSGPMVQALLAGNKAQTRRVVKLPKGRVSKKPMAMPDYIGRWVNGASSSLWAGFGTGEVRPDGVQNTVNTMRTGWFACPYGQLGDRLWVRETFYAFGQWVKRLNEETGKDEWHFIDLTQVQEYAYRFERPTENVGKRRADGGKPQWWKRPSIFMPRAASRLLLEIESVHVERLLDISQADAVAEGIEPVMCPTTGTVPARKWKNYLGRKYQDGMNLNYPIESYFSLWNSINGLDAQLDNPWCWVVKFRIVPTHGN